MDRCPTNADVRLFWLYWQTSAFILVNGYFFPAFCFKAVHALVCFPFIIKLFFYFPQIKILWLAVLPVCMVNIWLWILPRTYQGKIRPSFVPLCNIHCHFLPLICVPSRWKSHVLISLDGSAWFQLLMELTSFLCVLATASPQTHRDVYTW